MVFFRLTRRWMMKVAQNSDAPCNKELRAYQRLNLSRKETRHFWYSSASSAVAKRDVRCTGTRRSHHALAVDHRGCGSFENLWSRAYDRVPRYDARQKKVAASHLLHHDPHGGRLEQCGRYRRRLRWMKSKEWMVKTSSMKTHLLKRLTTIVEGNESARGRKRATTGLGR